MKRLSHTLLLTTLFSILSTYVALPAFPLIGAGLLLPGIGIFGSKLSSAQALMKNAHVTLLYVNLFLLVAVFCAAIVFFAWIYKLVSKRRATQQFMRVMTLFARLQADLIMLKSGLSLGTDASGDQGDLVALKRSKQKAVTSLLHLLQKKFFAKHIDMFLVGRMIDSLKVVQKGEVVVADQIMMVNQWWHLMRRFV